MNNGTGSGNLGGVTVRGQRHPDSYAGYESWESFMAWYESLLNEDGELVVEAAPLGEDDLIPLTPELAEYIAAILALEQDPEFTKLSEQLRQKIYKAPELTRICRDLFIDKGLKIAIGGSTLGEYERGSNTIWFTVAEILNPLPESLSRVLLAIAHELYHAQYADSSEFRPTVGATEAYATINSAEFMSRVEIAIPSGAYQGISGQGYLIADKYLAGEISRDEALQQIENLPYPELPVN